MILLENIQSIFCWPSQPKKTQLQGRQTIGKPRSATLEAEKFQEYWTDAPVLRIPGRMFPVWRPVKRLSTSLDRLKRRRLWIHERCTGQRKRFATTSQPFCEMQGRNLLHIATWERLSCSLFTQFVVFFDRLSSDGIGLTPPSPTFVKVYF